MAEEEEKKEKKEKPYPEQRKEAVAQAVERYSTWKPIHEADVREQAERPEWKSAKLAEMRGTPEFKQGYEEGFGATRFSGKPSGPIGQEARAERSEISKYGPSVAIPLDTLRRVMAVLNPLNPDPGGGVSYHHTMERNDPAALGRAEGAEASRRSLLRDLGQIIQSGTLTEEEIQNVVEEAQGLAGEK